MTALAIPMNIHNQVYQTKLGNSSTGMVDEEDKIAKSSEEPEKVLAFCERHNLRDYAEAALTMAEACFASEDLTIEVRKDPEIDDEWLLLRVEARLSAEEAMNAYAHFVRQWVKGVPLEDRGRIRLSYRIV